VIPPPVVYRSAASTDVKELTVSMAFPGHFLRDTLDLLLSRCNVILSVWLIVQWRRMSRFSGASDLHPMRGSMLATFFAEPPITPSVDVDV
jgi:hypothetical protein